MASSERIFKLLDEPVVVQSPAVPAVRPAPAAGHIVFDHVWFAYNEAPPERAAGKTGPTRLNTCCATSASR